MNTYTDSSTTRPDALVPAAEAASRFGYRDVQHFVHVAAQRLGITPLRRATHWHIWQSQIDAAISHLAAAGKATV